MPRPLRPNVRLVHLLRWRGAPGMAMTGMAGAGTRAAARAAPTGEHGVGWCMAGRVVPPHMVCGGRGRRIAAPVCELARNDRGGAAAQRLVAACLHREKRNYCKVLPGRMPSGDSRSGSGAGRYELQRLSSLANQREPYRRPDVPGVQGDSDRGMKSPVLSPWFSFRPLSETRKGTRRRHPSGSANSRNHFPDQRAVPDPGDAHYLLHIM